MRFLRRNLVLIYGLYAASIVSGLIVPPLLTHNLGKTEFGVWGFLLATTVYLSLLDFGVSPSLIRFAAKSRGASDAEELSALASIGLVVYALIGLVSVAAGAGLAIAVPYLIDMPSDLVTPARIAIVLIVFGAAFEFPLGLFGDLLVAQQRYDVTSIAGLASIAVYVGLIVGFVPRGAGLVGLAAIYTVTRLLRLALPLPWVRRELPFLRFSRRHVTRVRVRELMRFSIDNFVIHIAAKVVFNADAIVVGIVLGPDATALYIIASRAFSMASGLGSAATTMLSPTFAQFEGAEDRLRQRIYLRSSLRIGMAMMLALALPLICIPGRLITAWVGSSYASSAETLRVLGFVLLVGQPATVVMQYLLARGTQRRLTRFFPFRIIANIVLSIVLAKTVGIWGVALATLLVECTMLLLVPPFAFDESDPNWLGLARAWLRPVAPALAVAVPVFGLFAQSYDQTSLLAMVPVGLLWIVLLVPVTWFVGLDGGERAAILRHLRGSQPDRDAWAAQDEVAPVEP